jgi:hypothetical protein
MLQLTFAGQTDVEEVRHLAVEEEFKLVGMQLREDWFLTAAEEETKAGATEATQRCTRPLSMRAVIKSVVPVSVVRLNI